MSEIHRPNKRTFFKIQTSTVEHIGITEPNLVTSSKYEIQQSQNAEDVYPVLPNSGMLNEGDIYSYNSGMVEVVQSHERTNFPPEQTPALFNVYRANSDGAEWIANESVIAGDERTYEGQTYIAIQTHVTQDDWQPPNVPNLWKLMQQQDPSEEWQVGVSYSVDEEVTYNGVLYRCRQAHTSIAGWQPPNVPALWLEI